MTTAISRDIAVKLPHDFGVWLDEHSLLAVALVLHREQR